MAGKEDEDDDGSKYSIGVGARQARLNDHYDPVKPISGSQSIGVSPELWREEQ